MRFLLRMLSAVGSWIDYCLTRKCWVCGGTGEIEGVECRECKGERRL